MVDSVDEDTDAWEVCFVELVGIDVDVLDVWLRVLDSGLESSEEDSASVVWDRELVVESLEKDMEVCDVCSGLGLVYMVLDWSAEDEVGPSGDARVLESEVENEDDVWAGENRT